MAKYTEREVQLLVKLSVAQALKEAGISPKSETKPSTVNIPDVVVDTTSLGKFRLSYHPTFGVGYAPVEADGVTVRKGKDGKDFKRETHHVAKWEQIAAMLPAVMAMCNAVKAAKGQTAPAPSENAADALVAGLVNGAAVQGDEKAF